MWHWLSKIDPNAAIAILTAVVGVFVTKKSITQNHKIADVRAAAFQAVAWARKAFPVGTVEALQSEARLFVHRFAAHRGIDVTPALRGMIESILHAELPSPPLAIKSGPF